MSAAPVICGNAGPKVRSDCEISLELTSEGGISIGLVSKVKALYGNSIIKLINSILGAYSIENAVVKVNDCGALPFVIAARLEAAIRKISGTAREYLPDFIPENFYSTERDRSRYSRLYLPGNNPTLMINAGLHSADGIILDLEDSVAPEKKDEARILVRNALRQVNFYGAERMVRINQGQRGLEDLLFVIPHNVNLVIIPKCESPEEVIAVEREAESIRKDFRLPDDVFLMPVIESALGVENAFSIAKASGNVVALAIGLEDYTADIGVQRTNEGKESFYARSRLVVAARAAGIQPIDSVFSDIEDLDSLRETVRTSKALGFEGMGCIHPRQIPVIKEGFSPDEKEIEKAKSIVMAFNDAKTRGLGVTTVGSKMIDAPVVARAERTIRQAIRLGIIPENWMAEEHSN